MKLHNVPKNSKIKFANEIIHFYHLDGMYSYCKNNKGEVVHLVGWAEVELIK